MSIPQLADLFMVLPHDDMTELMGFLPREQAERIRKILSEREVTAVSLLSTDFIEAAKEATVGETLAVIRRPDRDPKTITYVYILNGPEKVLLEWWIYGRFCSRPNPNAWKKS